MTMNLHLSRLNGICFAYEHSPSLRRLSRWRPTPTWEFCIICELGNGARQPCVYVVDLDTEQKWGKHWPLEHPIMHLCPKWGCSINLHSRRANSHSTQQTCRLHWRHQICSSTYGVIPYQKPFGSPSIGDTLPCSGRTQLKYHEKNLANWWTVNGDSEARTGNQGLDSETKCHTILATIILSSISTMEIKVVDW